MRLPLLLTGIRPHWLYILKPQEQVGLRQAWFSNQLNKTLEEMNEEVILSLTFLALGLAFLLASVPTNNVDAQGRPDDPGSQSAVRANGKVVAPDGVVFESHKAFIDAGRKCSTRHVDDIEMEEIDKHAADHGRANGRKGDVGGTDDGARLYPNGSISIPVYFHVVYRSDGVGNISELARHKNAKRH